MRKLKLDVDALEVESFRTTRTQEAAGTVRAHYTLAAQGCDTDDSCRGTCGGNTCWDTGSCVGCDSYDCGGTVDESHVYTCEVTCGTCVGPCTDTCTYELICTANC